MANNINCVVITGNLTRDPELRHTAGGLAVCVLRLAVNGREKVNDQWQDRADFFNVRVFGNQAENCAQYLAKGRAAGVSGRLRFEEWDKDGQKKSQTIIVADTVQFLGSRDGGESRVPDEAFAAGEGDFSRGDDSDFAATSTSGGDFAAGACADDDIPF